jgi:very-short-patch-repair endonuclease
MNANQLDIARLLRANDGIITRRECPHLADPLAHLVSTGRLRTLLPGVYVDPIGADEPIRRMRAGQAWARDAVLTHEAAARLTFWPEVPLPQVRLAVGCRRQGSTGYIVTRRCIPPELVTSRAGLRCTAPALTALDLCTTYGGEAIDAALRSRQVTLPDLYEALELTRKRRGNGDRRLLLLESRDSPWSEAERAAHRLMHAERIVGWTANYPLPLLGLIYCLDLAFPAQMLAVEIDGRAFHDDPVAFESDRWRQNDIILAGWRVLRFTWRMLTEQPQVVVAAIRQALAS